MTTKYILIVAVALIPAAMKGMTGGNDYSHQSSEPTRPPLVCDDGLSYKDALSQLNQGHSRRDWANARNLAKAQKHRDIKGMFDSKPCTEWNPFTPNSGEPSFFNRFGNQFAAGIALTCAGLITTILVKKYLTPKAMLYRENIELTVKENTVLEKIEPEIQRSEKAIPLCERDLARRVEEFRATYNEEPKFPVHALPAGIKITVTPNNALELDQTDAQISEEEKLKNKKMFEIANLVYSLEHVKNNLAQYKAQRDEIRAAQNARSFA